MKKEAPENEASYFSHGLLTAVCPKSNQVFCSSGSSALPLPAPAEQTQRAEAGGEEREGVREWRSGDLDRRGRPQRIDIVSRTTVSNYLGVVGTY